MPAPESRPNDANALSYREAAASPDLAPLVRSFWEFAVRDGAGGPIPHEAPPDGCVSISFSPGRGGAGPRLTVVGPRLDALRVPVWGGSRFWGVRLAPAAAGAVLGREPGSLRGQIAELGEVATGLAADLLARLAVSADFEQAVAAYEAGLRALGPRGARIDPAAERAAAVILEARGDVAIPEVAEAVGLGPRQLERRFRAAVGLTPKQFARVRRLRATAKLLVAGGPASWAGRAAEMGFADQSHMTREFGSATGRSPGRFVEIVRRIDHGELVD